MDGAHQYGETDTHISHHMTYQVLTHTHTSQDLPGPHTHKYHMTYHVLALTHIHMTYQVLTHIT